MLRSTWRGQETWHGRDGVTLADERARQQGIQTSTYTGAPVLDPTCERPGVQLLRPTLPVTWNGMGIPLLWMLLPTAGNSHTSERTELLDRLRAAFPDLKIAALMGDREFIGDAWMAYLQRENIPFILRLRENQHVLREG
jgi:hypothetical protein